VNLLEDFFSDFTAHDGVIRLVPCNLSIAHALINELKLE